MDGATLLLLIVVGVVAASQLLQHAGSWILKPYLFWPVEGLLATALVVVLVYRFLDFPPQIVTMIRLFLGLFLAWRIVHNWAWRNRVRERQEPARVRGRGAPPPGGD